MWDSPNSAGVVIDAIRVVQARSRSRYQGRPARAVGLPDESHRPSSGPTTPLGSDSERFIAGGSRVSIARADRSSSPLRALVRIACARPDGDRPGRRSSWRCCRYAYALNSLTFKPPPRAPCCRRAGTRRALHAVRARVRRSRQRSPSSSKPPRCRRRPLYANRAGRVSCARKRPR